MPEIGDVYIDNDPHRGPTRGPLHVILVVKRPEHVVKKDTAVCLVRGKVTPIAVARLEDPSRFTKSFPFETVPAAR